MGVTTTIIPYSAKYNGIIPVTSSTGAIGSLGFGSFNAGPTLVSTNLLNTGAYANFFPVTISGSITQVFFSTEVSFPIASGFNNTAFTVSATILLYNGSFFVAQTPSFPIGFPIVPGTPTYFAPSATTLPIPIPVTAGQYVALEISIVGDSGLADYIIKSGFYASIAIM